MPNFLYTLSYVLPSFHDEQNFKVAKLFHVEQNTLSSWKKRNKIPYEKLDELSLEHAISMDWLLGGEDKYESYKELLADLELLPKEKKEIYLLRIKADVIEAINNAI